MAGFVKAVREDVWLKIQFGGTSGAGKTYTALRVGTGIARKCNSRIAFISSEKSRTLYYADKFDYDVLELDNYSPEDYIKAIDMAVEAGYKVIIIDSTSHEWQWLNDVHGKMPGNSFQNWGKLKPRHAKFMAKILQCPAHVLTCARGKTEWSLEDKDGKKVPIKLGLGNEGDKQADFEYTVSFMIAQGTHIASVDAGGKDNTGLFDEKYEVLTERHGEMLYDWANSGVRPASIPKDIPEPGDAIAQSADDLKAVKMEIVNAAKAAGGKDNEDVINIIKKYAPSGNPNSVKDIDKAKELLADLENLSKN